LIRRNWCLFLADRGVKFAFWRKSRPTIALNVREPIDYWARGSGDSVPPGLMIFASIPRKVRLDLNSGSVLSRLNAKRLTEYISGSRSSTNLPTNRVAASPIALAVAHRGSLSVHIGGQTGAISRRPEIAGFNWTPIPVPPGMMPFPGRTGEMGTGGSNSVDSEVLPGAP
jgi:hypothetical protein